MEETNFVTCLCQHCNGRIKFDATRLNKGETKQIECPHCHFETILYVPVTEKKSHQFSYDKTNPINTPKSSKSELIFFQFTRFVTLAFSFLVLFALIIAGFLVLQTFLPEKPPAIQNVDYESVAPVIETEPSTQATIISTDPKMAAKGAFPQPVINFLVSHEGFSLKEWLDQLKPEHRKPFLENLAIIIETGNNRKLTDEQSEKLVKDYSELWISINEKPPDPNAKLEKSIYRSSCISVAFGLFLALTILCLILVLLAIERNTRFVTNDDFKTP